MKQISSIPALRKIYEFIWRCGIWFFEPLTLVEMDRPHRRHMRWAFRYYNVLIRFSIVGVLLATTWRNFGIAIFIISSYIGAIIFFKLFAEHQSGRPNPHFHFIRAFIYIVGATVAYAAYIFWGPADINAKDTIQIMDDTLWLIYVLAVFHASQYGGSTRSLITLTFLSALSILVISLGLSWDRAQAIKDDQLRIAISRGLWLVLISAIFHTLNRFSLERLANQHLLSKLQADLAAKSYKEDEQTFMNSVTQIIAQSMNGHYVSIFARQEDRSLKLVSGYVFPDKRYINQTIHLEAGQGIIGHTLMSNSGFYYSNKVDSSPHYYRHHAFQLTGSELAVRFGLGLNQEYILDIQVDRNNHFFEWDESLFQSIARQLEHHLASFKRIKQQHHLTELATKMAKMAAAPESAEKLLESIAATAKLSFGADIVTLHERDSLSKQVVERKHAGEFFDGRSPEGMHRANNLADRLCEYLTGDCFHNDVKNLADDPVFNPKEDSYTALPSFENREGIKSRAILYLGDGNYCLGLLFINFRTQHTFSEEEMGQYHLLRHMATLAIQNAQRARHDRQRMNERFGADLHDNIISHGYHVYAYLDKLRQSQNLGDYERRSLIYADFHLQQLRDNARILSRGTQAHALGLIDFYEEIKALIQNMQASFGDAMTFEFTSDNCPSKISGQTVAQIHQILHELLLNAYRHSKASLVQTCVEGRGTSVCISVIDNGRGFDVKNTPFGGLKNAIRRINEIGGSEVNIQSSISLGTKITFNVPVAQR